jgi:hypothetical protein
MLRDYCRTLVLTQLLVVSIGGCAKPKLIPNTKVKDSETNRKILSVIESYRRAMERLDAPAVLALAHPTYRDNGGTPEGVDDVDYGGLKDLLATRFKRVKKVRYRIEYQDCRAKGREARVDAYIDATFMYHPPDAEPRWRRLTDHARFLLVKEGETWRFLSGL